MYSMFIIIIKVFIYLLILFKFIMMSCFVIMVSIKYVFLQYGGFYFQNSSRLWNKKEEIILLEFTKKSLKTRKINN